MQASFLSDAKAESLLGGIAGARRPWFGKEIILKPRDALVAVPGYTFVSADYSQVDDVHGDFSAIWDATYFIPLELFFISSYSDPFGRGAKIRSVRRVET